MSTRKRAAVFALLTAALLPAGALGIAHAQADQPRATLRFAVPPGQKREMQGFTKIDNGDCRPPFFARLMGRLGNPIAPDIRGPFPLKAGERFYLLGETHENGRDCNVSGSFIPESGGAYTASVVVLNQFTAARRCMLRITDDATGTTPASYTDHSQNCGVQR